MFLTEAVYVERSEVSVHEMIHPKLWGFSHFSILPSAHVIFPLRPYWWF